ncbi:hypothetical protein SVAN01_04746 [Stagonosporopsis vannaccii]|nr:hypothetical protein SVAN01_04746 [Stagonosporopsis vannaccii]
MSTPPASLLMDDRSPAIKFTYPVLVFVSSSFVVLRIWNDIRTKKRWYRNASDWLLALAQICAIVGTCFGYMTAWYGAGKHVWDPSVTKADLGVYQKYLWFGQYFNLTAMAALKFSICAFMLQLDFSKTYRRLIWASVIVHLSFNVIYPYIILFGECDPVAKHWDPTMPGFCWPSKPRVVSGYLGAGSNIGSDFFYACAPLIYTRKVQLPRRTIWGVRVVFLLGFITTIISAFKLYEIKALAESHDIGYESVNLSILSVSEVLVGTLTASLPPLRRLFENTLSKFMPDSVMGTKDRSQAMPSYVLPEYSLKNPIQAKRDNHDCDDNSEKTILADVAGSSTYVEQGRSREILRTTHVSLSVNNIQPTSIPRTEDWA